MTVLKSSPTNSPQRVVPYFFTEYFGSIFSRTNRFYFENDYFLIHGLGKCEGVGEDSRHGDSM